MRHRDEPQRPKALENPGGATDDGVVGEPLQEFRVVVVQTGHEAHALEPLLALGSDHDDAVRPLPGTCELSAGENGAKPPSAKSPRRIRR